jgi:phage I-like protein
MIKKQSQNIFDNALLSKGDNRKYVSVFNNLVKSIESDISNYNTKKYEVLKNIKSKVTNKISKSDHLYKETYNSTLDYNSVKNVKTAHISKADKVSTLNQSMNMDYKTTTKNEEHISIKEFEKVSKEVVVLKEKIKDMETKNSIKKKTPKSKTRIFDSLSDKERLERQRRGDF